MSKQFHIGGHIPAAALNQHIALLGKTRSGKSSVMRRITEGLLDEHLPVCIIDPKGDWWGLKSSADGKKAGYPVVIFGGEHADVPLNAHAGSHIAELVATGNRPCIIDLGGWMVGERTRFFIDFASTLFRLTKGSRWLVIDECHNFAPQGKVVDPDAGKMLHWANRLASEGLGKGLAIIAASQRPQKVHKDFLTCFETLIAMRVIHPLDRGAVKDWIDGCPDAKKGAEVLASLASMGRGEGWAWSPEIGFGPERVKFPMFSTYDSFRDRSAERSHQLRGWASVDLDDVKAKLAKVVEEAKANDPKELRRQVSELTAALTKAEQAKPAAAKPDIQKVDVPVVTDADLKRIENAQASMLSIVDGLASKIQPFYKKLENINDTLIEIMVKARAIKAGPDPIALARKAADFGAAVHVNARGCKPMTPRAAKAIGRMAKAATAMISGDGAITGPMQRIIDAVAWWNAFGIAQPKREAVAFIARYTPTSGGFNNPLGTLRTMGLVDYPAAGLVALTDSGRASANQPDSSPTRDEAHDRVRSVLDGPKRRIFDALLSLGGLAPREVLAEKSQYEPTSGGFNNPLGTMRSIGLIDYPSSGQVELAEFLR